MAATAAAASETMTGLGIFPVAEARLAWALPGVAVGPVGAPGAAGPVDPPPGVAEADADADAPAVGVADGVAEGTTWPLPGLAVEPFGDPGLLAGAAGVADTAPDAGPSPALLTAVTVKE
jgi:hypothetical protein